MSVSDYELVQSEPSLSSRDFHFVQSESSLSPLDSQGVQSDSSDNDKEDDIALLPSRTQRLANIRLQTNNTNRGNFPIPSLNLVVSSSVKDEKCDERKSFDIGVDSCLSDLDYRSCSSSKEKYNEELKLLVCDKREQNGRIKESSNEERKLPVYDERKLEQDKTTTEIRCNTQETLLDQQKESAPLNGTCVGKESDSCGSMSINEKEITISSKEKESKLYPSSSNDFMNINKGKNLTTLSSTPCLSKKKKKKDGVKSSRKSFIDDLLFSGDDDDSLLGVLDKLEKPAEGECLKVTPSQFVFSQNVEDDNLQSFKEGECVKSTPSRFVLSQNIEDDSLLGASDILTQPKKGECLKSTPSHLVLPQNVENDSLLGTPDVLMQPKKGECLKSTPSHFVLSQNVEDDSLLGILVELQEHSGEKCRHETPSPPCCINLSTPNIAVEEDDQQVLKDVSNNFSQLGDSILGEDDKDVFQGTPSLGNHRKQTGCQDDDKENLNDAVSTVADFESSLRRKLNLTTTVKHNVKNENESDDKPRAAHEYETASSLEGIATVSNTLVSSSPMCLADRLKARFRDARKKY